MSETDHATHSGLPYRTEEQDRELELLARRTHRPRSELIREAIALLLQQNVEGDWRRALHRVRGLWADRSDVEAELAAVRADVQGRLEGR